MAQKPQLLSTNIGDLYMPEITIEKSTFERLQGHAKPFVDTPDMIIRRALDALEKRKENITQGKDYAISERQIEPHRLPNLTHTKVLTATIGEEHIDRPNWNLLVERMLIEAMKRLNDFEQLNSLCAINMTQGRKDDEGYRHLSEIGISFQGLPASEACNALVMIAQSLGIELEIGFMWRNKQGAEYPGEKARLQVPSR